MLVFSRHFVFNTVTLNTNLALTFHLGEYLFRFIYLIYYVSLKFLLDVGYCTGDYV